MDKIEEKFLLKVKRYAPILKAVPYVAMAAVCNSSAFSTCNEKSDIDLFVVAKKGRLYISRAFMNMFLRVLGARTYGKCVAGRFCLSFFVDEERLNLLEIAKKKDVYLAYWIYKLKPVFDRGVLEKFESENKWILSILGKKKVEIDRSLLVKNRWFFEFLTTVFRKVIEILMIWVIGDFFEWLLRKIQINKIRRRIKKIGEESGRADFIISKNLLKLHENDRRILFRDAYFKVAKGSFDEEKFINVLKEFHGK